MNITITNAYANNLKNISLSIPIGKITGITGISGSGKSTLLKNILGAYGAKKFTLVTTKTIKDALLVNEYIDVDKIENLPNTILIDVKSVVSTPNSTVSTVSGIHHQLRTLFISSSKAYCKICGNILKPALRNIFCVDLKMDAKFQEAIDYIQSDGEILAIDYYDKNGNPTTNSKKKELATIIFKLHNSSEEKIHNFNITYKSRIYAYTRKQDTIYDAIRECECENCNAINPTVRRSRFSFNTSYCDGGGACRCCNGTGTIVEFNTKMLFADKKKSILSKSSPLITNKGIKYTTVTEKALEAVFSALDIRIDTPIESIPEEILNKILYGIESEITFKDRIGGKKTIVYKGIVNYLLESYHSGKHTAVLSPYLNKTICPKCKGIRLDYDISIFKLSGKSLAELLNMTLSELGEWCKSVDIHSLCMQKIIKKIEYLNQLSCGHLALYRASNTLSGGELQRIRVCTLLASNTNAICYLLDEPSSGLHYSDIESLGNLFKSLCEAGNTLIMVEHNQQLLKYCDYLVDLGPLGGKDGGNVLFCDEIINIHNYDTPTSTALLASKYSEEKTFSIECENFEDYLEFPHLNFNNLKNISIRIPRDSFTVVCGISGSGKSTLVKQAIYHNIVENPSQYGFQDVIYLGQATKVRTSRSTVSSILNINTYIAILFEKASTLKKSFFMPNSTDGKCPFCFGKGYIYSENDEPIAICETCNGTGFEEDVLAAKVDNLNIHDWYHSTMDFLYQKIKDTKILKIIETASLLGVGYLSLDRASKTLSKGELQRISLINIMMTKEKKQLIILDEPSKGLHSSDSMKLINALYQISANHNTIIAVEHNPTLISHADYIIELGGTGPSGGYLLFQGNPRDLIDTPTHRMLSENSKIFPLSTKATTSEIEIKHENIYKIYQPFKIYHEYTYGNLLLEAAKQSKNHFLSVAIPNNAIFLDKNEIMLNTKAPIIQIIDFDEKIKYPISILQATDLSSLLENQASKENCSKMARYLFNPNSSTGKCSICKGTGKVFSVPVDFFLEHGELSSACKKFIQNSTDYTRFSKYLKKKHININQSLSQMSETEKNILFWGIDEYCQIDGTSLSWEGIINYFVRFYKYYPNQNSENIIKKKTEIDCPCCKGQRVKIKYTNFKCSNLSYHEWLTLSIDTLLSKLPIQQGNEKIVQNLKLLQNLGLGQYTLNAQLINMNSISAEKIKLISLYLNRIFGIGIIIKNMEILGENEQEKINKLIKELSTTNTIWII